MGSNYNRITRDAVLQPSEELEKRLAQAWLAVLKKVAEKAEAHGRDAGRAERLALAAFTHYAQILVEARAFTRSLPEELRIWRNGEVAS